MALGGDLYHRWEQETRQASCRGLEGLLPPADEWGSFLDAPAPLTPEESIDLERLERAEAGLGEAAAPETASREKPGAEKAADTAQPPPLGGVNDLPESQLPENLRAEIEDFLNRDRPTPASDDEVSSLLKGGFDPNVEPEE